MAPPRWRSQPKTTGFLSAAGPGQGPSRCACSSQESLDTISVLVANSEADGTVLFTDRQTPKQGLSTTSESWQAAEKAGTWA